MYRVVNESQGIRDKDGDALTKDGGQQSLTPKRHAAQYPFLLLGDSHDGCQPKARDASATREEAASVSTFTATFAS